LAAGVGAHMNRALRSQIVIFERYRLGRDKLEHILDGVDARIWRLTLYTMS